MYVPLCFRVEKDATNWSKSKFRELFVGLKVEDDTGKLVLLNKQSKFMQFTFSGTEQYLIYRHVYLIK